MQDGRSALNPLHYAHNLILLVGSKSDLQRFLFNFNQTCQRYNIKTIKDKTKSIMIPNEHLNHTLVINDNL